MDAPFQRLSTFEQAVHFIPDSSKNHAVER
jgi:hypothetical protein